MIFNRAKVLAPLIAGALALSPGAAADPPARPPIRATLAFQKLTLPNGLTVLVHEDHRAAVIALRLSYRVGAKDDPANRRGMSKLMRRLLADGSTRHLANDDRSKLAWTMGTERWDVHIDADTDATWIELTVPSAALDLALWMESDRMAFLADGIEAETLASWRKAQADDELAGLDMPYARVMPEVRRAVYGPEHPYSRTSETSTELTAVTAAEMRARLHAWYGPANAVLTLAGDVTKDRAMSIVTRYFGPIVARPRPPAAAPGAAAPAGERRVRIEAAVDAPRVVLAWPTPPLYHPDDVVLDAIASILMARFKDRLMGSAPIAKDFAAAQMSRHLGSELAVFATLSPGHTIDEARAVMEREITRLQTEDSLPLEVERAGLQHLTSRLLRADSPTGRAAMLASFELATGDPGGFTGYVEAYRTVTPAAIRKAAVTYLRADRRVVAEVIPTLSAPKAGRLVGGGP